MLTLAQPLAIIKKNGQWMNRDDVMVSRGLVLFNGKYVTPHKSSC